MKFAAYESHDLDMFKTLGFGGLEFYRFCGCSDFTQMCRGLWVSVIPLRWAMGLFGEGFGCRVIGEGLGFRVMGVSKNGGYLILGSL